MARKVSRVSKRADMLRTASQVRVPDACDVCVIGGGAAGLAAAIAAAVAGARVLVLERDLECGRTILVTGNGRCNFANRHLDPNLYNNSEFVEGTCGPSWLDDVLGFFDSCGLAWAEEAEGRLYPLSRQAASVRNVLLLRAQDAGVVLAPAREVTHLAKRGSAYSITFSELWDGGRMQTVCATSVVCAVGGAATSLYAELGLKVVSPTPLLCPLACKGPALDKLDGRRVRATAQLRRAKRTVAQESGEVLFRSYGLSGIAIFNLSRHAQPGDMLALDLLPMLSTQDTRRLGASTLDGILDPAIAQALVQASGSPSDALTLAKSLAFIVVGTAETERAQVRRGGLSVEQFDPATLEARSAPCLFACGEALDVDGPCGGYNLAWAWKSGMVAGNSAARGATTKEEER